MTALFVLAAALPRGWMLWLPLAWLAAAALCSWHLALRRQPPAVRVLFASSFVLVGMLLVAVCWSLAESALRPL